MKRFWTLHVVATHNMSLKMALNLIERSETMIFEFYIFKNNSRHEIEIDKFITPF